MDSQLPSLAYLKSSPGVKMAPGSPAFNEVLRGVAEEFEAIFAQQMIKQARDSKLADDLFGGTGNETFKTMLDEEYARKMAHGSSLGIADALVQQLSPQKPMTRGR